MKAIEVVAGLIRSGNKYLLCRRPMHKARGGQWEFAGGKVEPGETKARALAREFREELAVELNVGETIAETTHSYPDLKVHLSLLEAEIASGELQALEHSELAWAELHELHLFDLCPADRELVQLVHERIWRKEEELAHIRGWDFSHISGRYSEEDDLPWDYRAIIHAFRSPEHRLLDMDTGGGEFLLSLDHPHANTAAMEAYGPNVLLCKQTLIPLGVDFREGGAAHIPFADEAFDLVLNRHGDFDAAEIARVLRPGGLFITQQVGAENDRELVQLLLPDARTPFPDQTLACTEEKFRAAGFEIIESREAFRPIRFYDVGALVWFARIIEWEFPGFSVEKCLPRLHDAQRMLENSHNNISEVAASVGFDSLTHFERVFKTIQGVTPREYIRQQKAAEPKEACSVT